MADENGVLGSTMRPGGSSNDAPCVLQRLRVGGLGPGKNGYVARRAEDRQAAETIARRRADTCEKVAGKERELARSARAKAQLAQAPGQRANLEQLARVHADAAALQAEAATYYRGLADRIAGGLPAPGGLVLQGSGAPPDGR
jgi:hypothetical protein